MEIGHFIAFGVTAGISVAAIFGAKGFFKKKMHASAGADREDLVAQFNQIEEKLSELRGYLDSCCSDKQLGTLNRMVEEVHNDLENEKKSLVETERKLEVSQKSVEDKEAVQQEIKSSSEKDEEVLAELLSTYSEISSESVALEQKLAASLKNLDQILEEVTLTSEQRTVLTELSNALTNAGALLRDLITEHSALKERLELLKEQHEDLEDEYTRLVEQQLGE